MAGNRQYHAGSVKKFMNIRRGNLKSHERLAGFPLYRIRVEEGKCLVIFSGFFRQPQV